MAKLVDAPDLGSGVLRRVGSSPITRTMRQKRNFTTKNSSFFVVKSTMPTAVGQTKYGRSSYHLGRDKTTLSIKKQIDNASSKSSGEAPRQWCRVGCGWQVLSILLSESTMRAAIGHAKHRRMWCRVGCGWQVLSIITRIDNACSIRSQDAWHSHALRVAVSYFRTTTRIPIYKNKKCKRTKRT